MKTKVKYKVEKPYVLHDTTVNRMKLKDHHLTLKFDGGYYQSYSENKVEGKIKITQIDEDFCSVIILNEYGKRGCFKAKKMSLKKWIKKHPDFRFEITDELYDYNKISYGGYYYSSKSTYEMMINIYYLGEIIYKTKEE